MFSVPGKVLTAALEPELKVNQELLAAGVGLNARTVV